VLEARVLRDDIWWPSGIEVLCETLMGSRRGRARNGGTTSPLLAALEPFTFKVNKMCLFAVHYLGTLCSADIQRQCFSLIPNQHQPLASQQYFSLIANQHQPLVIISETK